MARIASFIVLVAFLLLIGGLFIRVMVDFIVPLFLAVLLVVVFSPMHRWVVQRARGHDRVAAGVSTAVILLAVLMPAAIVIVTATVQAIGIVRRMQADVPPAVAADDAEGEMQIDPRGLARAIADAGMRVGLDLSADDVYRTMSDRMQEWVGPFALGTTQWLLRLVFGFFVMAVALYYFLADGPEMLASVMRLLPLDDKYEQQLVEQFGGLSRTIVLASLVSALAQALLAGAGYYFAGVGSLVFLTVTTALMAMVPFVGSTIVWVPVCLYLYFYDGRPTAAITLGIYCTIVVSTIDNVVKPLILHGGANLHPLLALLSVIGGVQALGPIGLFIGPMVVAFLQTLLTMFNAELTALSQGVPLGQATAAKGKKR